DSRLVHAKMALNPSSAPLLTNQWSTPSALLVSRSEGPHPSSLLLHPEFEYCGSPIGLRERRTGMACSAARSESWARAPPDGLQSRAPLVRRTEYRRSEHWPV